MDELEAAVHQTTSDYDREKCKERLSNLLAGILGGEAALPVSQQRLAAKPSPFEPWWAARRLVCNWGLLGAGALLLLFGLGTGLVEGTTLDTAEQSASWPSVAGEILSSRFERKQSYDRKSWVNQALVSYAYSVDGARYEGSRIRYRDHARGAAGDGVGGIGWGSRAQAEAAVATYPVGKQVRVHYDPAHPDRSVLEPGAAYVNRAFQIMAPLLIGLGTLFLLLFTGGWLKSLIRKTEPG